MIDEMLGGTPEPTRAAEPDSEAAGSEDSGATLAVAAFERLAASSMDAVMDRPAVDAALGRAWDSIGSDPAVSGAGDALLSGIGSHPEFGPTAGNFLKQLQQSSEFIDQIREFAARNPGMEPAALEAAFGAHVDAQVARPEVSVAIDGAVGRLLERPVVSQGLDKLTHSITEKAGVAQVMGSAFVDRLSDPATLSKLEVRVGVKQSDPGFEPALLAHLTDGDRLEKFMLGFAAQFGEHPAPRKAVVDLLSSPDVLGSSSRRLAKTLEAPEFYPKAETALVAVIAGADSEALGQALDGLLSMPEVESGFAGWFDDLAQSEEIRNSFAAAFIAVLADPAFDELLAESFLD
jgi:hypothetical protein